MIVKKYLDYLNTPRLQYNGVVEKPARESTIKKFISVSETNFEVEAKKVVEKALSENRKVLCWSDHHFNHDMLWKNNLRPFQSREEMTNKMLLSLKNVSKDDVLIFGGDLCFYNFREIIAEINRVDCEKIYVLGNHDVRDNSMLNELKRSFNNLVLAFDFNIGEMNFVVSHYPMSRDFLDNSVNLHGHTHNYLMGDGYINMCVEHTGYNVELIQTLCLNQGLKIE